MRINRIFSILAMAAIGSQFAYSATFSANQGGSLGSSSVIAADGSGDYLSLSAASQDFTGYSGGATGNYSFLIKTDLSETVSSAFGNKTNGFKVTLKPDSGSSVTVSFNQAADNPTLAFTGDILIGAKNLTERTSLAETHGFTIDGSNNGTDSKNLTIEHNTAAGFNFRLVRVCGNSDNVTLKNCILRSKAARASHGFSLTSSGNNIPENAIVNNNIFDLPYVTSQVISTGSVDTAPTAGSAISGTQITNNYIHAGQRAIFLDVHSGATISNNTIKMIFGGNGYFSTGIRHNGANSSTGYSINITNNIMNEYRSGNINNTGEYGISAIHLGGSSGTYNVINNIITGFKFTGSASAIPAASYRAIYAAGSSNNLNVYNNSIYMASFDKLLAASPMQYLGAISTYADTYAGAVANVNIKNNLVVVEATVGTGGEAQIPALKVSDKAGNAIDNNNIWVGTGGIYARVTTTGGTANAGTSYATKASLTAAVPAYEVNSTTLDPRIVNAPGTGKWASLATLNFDGDPGAPLRGVPIASVTTDILGVTRSITAPTKGAYEVNPPANVDAWQLY